MRDAHLLRVVAMVLGTVLAGSLFAGCSDDSSEPSTGDTAGGKRLSTCEYGRIYVNTLAGLVTRQVSVDRAAAGSDGQESAVGVLNNIAGAAGQSVTNLGQLNLSKQLQPINEGLVAAVREYQGQIEALREAVQSGDRARIAAATPKWETGVGAKLAAIEQANPKLHEELINCPRT